MKKILALFLLTLAFIALCACSGAANITEPPVQSTQAPSTSTSVTTSATTSVTTAATTQRTEVSVNSNGAVIEKVYYNSYGTVEKREKFNEDGKLYEIFEYNEYGAAERYELYTYDENGKIAGKYVEIGKYNKTGVKLEKKYEQRYNENDALIEEIVYSFNEQGRAATGNVNHYDEEGNRIYMGVIYFHSNNVFSETSGTHFDKEGNITKQEKVQYDESGNIKFVSVSEYTKDYVITKKTEQIFSYGQIISEEFLYDEDGDLKSGKETTVYIQEEIISEVQKTYHKESGNEATRVVYDEDGEILSYESFSVTGARIHEVKSLNVDGLACWQHDKYSADFQLTESIFYLKSDKTVYRTNKYTYRENGRVKRIDTYNAENELIAYKEYDKYGKLEYEFPEKNA